jgi:hypothetical protein
MVACPGKRSLMESILILDQHETYDVISVSDEIKFRSSDIFNAVNRKIAAFRSGVQVCSLKSKGILIATE